MDPTRNSNQFDHGFQKIPDKLDLDKLDLHKLDDLKNTDDLKMIDKQGFASPALSTSQHGHTYRTLNNSTPLIQNQAKSIKRLGGQHFKGIKAWFKNLIASFQNSSSMKLNLSLQKLIQKIESASSHEAQAKNIKILQQKADFLLKHKDFKHFSPKLRELRRRSESLLEQCNNKINPKEELRNLASDFSQLINVSSKLESDISLEISDIDICAVDYGTINATSMKTFAEDSTGISSQQLDVSRFAAAALGLRTINISMKKVQAGMTSGASGDPVYLVHDKHTQKLLCVIKVGTIDNARDEVNSLRLMRNQRLSKCHFPEVLGVGKGRIDGQEMYFYAQSAAEGITLDKYMEQLGQAADVKEKTKAQQALKTAVGHLARGMGELHKKTSANPESKIEQSSSQTRYNEKMKENIHFLESERQDINFEPLKLMAEQMKFTLPNCIIHGDFHPGNAFVSDQVPPRLTLIDNGSAIESFNQETQQPTGIAVYDFALCYQWLIVLAKINNIDPDATNDLITSFENDYLAARGLKGPELETLKKEMAYMKTFIAINYIANLIEIQKTPEHPWNKLLGDKIEEIINILILNFGATNPV